MIDAASIQQADMAAAWAVRRGLWHDFDEASAEARLILVELSGKWDPERGERKQFLAIRIRQRLIDRWRQCGEMGDRRRAPTPTVTDTIPEHDAAPSAEDVLVEYEAMMAFQQALLSLSPRELAVIQAATRRGGCQRLAEQWGIDPGQVSALKRIAIKHLREALEIAA